MEQPSTRPADESSPRKNVVDLMAALEASLAEAKEAVRRQERRELCVENRGGEPVPDRFIPDRPARPWLHEIHGDPLLYRWLVKNRVMRNDEHGIEITYRARRDDDVVCGARTIRTGIPGFKGYSWRADQSIDHEVVCSVVGDHGETPHIGVPADCADMVCQCRAYGSYHLVIVGFARRAALPAAVADRTPDEGK